MLRLITSFASLLLIGASISGCSGEESTASLTSDAGLYIPAHLQGIENLTVYPADVEPTYDIQFFEEFVFDTVNSFVDGTLNVDDRGYVLVGRHKIEVYDPDGSLIAEMGGSGQGPGEFSNFSAVNLQMSDSRVFGVDDMSSRINHYSLETYSSTGAFLLDPAAWQRLEGMQSTNLYPSRYFALNDSTLLMGFAERLSLDSESSNNSEDVIFLVPKEIKYYLMDMEGQIISDLITTQTEKYACPSGGVLGICAQVGKNLLFFEQTILGITSDGEILKADSDEIHIEFLDSEGDYVRSFYHPYSRTEFNVSQLGLDEEAEENYLEKKNLPESWPAFKSMIIDDQNRIWLSTIKADDDTLEWWILNEDGTLLAKFEWPGKRQLNSGYRNIGIKIIKHGHIYAYDLTDEFGLGKLSRYRFELTER